MRKNKLEDSIHISDKAWNLITSIKGDIDNENGSVDINNIDCSLNNMNMLTNKTMESLVIKTIYK